MKKSKGFFWAYIDLLFALVGGFMAMACLAVVAKTTPQEAGIDVGTLTIEMQWPMGSQTDMDLWVRPPGDRPIGYSRKTGKFCDLIRDDLGALHDIASRATEIVACRRTPPGEYVINANAYAFRDQGAIPIRVFVRHQRPGSEEVDTLLTRSTTVDHDGQEVTVVRFTLDTDGAVVPGSVNNLYRELRSTLE